MFLIFPSVPEDVIYLLRADAIDIRNDNFFTLACCESLYLSCAISPFEAFAQEKSTAYLDLALRFPRWKNWESFMGTKVQRSFPLPLREFLLAERVDQMFRFKRLLLEFVEFHFTWYRTLLDSEISDLCNKFKHMLFNEFTNKSNVIKIRNIYRYLKMYRASRVGSFRMMCPHLIQLCIPLDCELTVAVLRTLCDTDRRKVEVFYIILNEGIWKALIDHAKTMKFNFWGIWDGSSNLALQFDFIHDFMRYGINQEYSRLLLKSGFQYRAKLNSFYGRSTFLFYLRFDEGRQVVKTAEPLFRGTLYEGYSTRMMLIMDTFLIFGAFYSNRDWEIEDYKKTLICLTRSLPEPYVTPSELYSKMQEVVVPDFLPHLKAITEKYSDIKDFDHEHESHFPRRLQHLCRVVIRKSLAGNFKLLHGIEELKVPSQIQSYLELDC